MVQTSMVKVVGTIGLWAVMTTAVAAQPRPEPVTLADVLRELQTIRTDLHDMSRVSLRVQALVARVSLQEQRLKALSEQLNAANAQLTSAVHERESREQRLKMLEDSLMSVPPGAQRDEIEQVVAIERRALTPMLSRESELRARASELAGLVSAEQDRWTDFNNRLDAVEQSLQPR